MTLSIPVQVAANTEQSESIWPMVNGMLTNLGPSDPETIKRTLAMFMPDLSLTVVELKGLLDLMVEQDKLDFDGQMYKIQE